MRTNGWQEMSTHQGQRSFGFVSKASVEMWRGPEVNESRQGYEYQPCSACRNHVPVLLHSGFRGSGHTGNARDTGSSTPSTQHSTLKNHSTNIASEWWLQSDDLAAVAKLGIPQRDRTLTPSDIIRWLRTKWCNYGLTVLKGATGAPPMAFAIMRPCWTWKSYQLFGLGYPTCRRTAANWVSSCIF